MTRPRSRIVAGIALAAALCIVRTRTQTLEPLSYTIRFPAPATKTFEVSVAVPAAGRRSVDLMMPVWSPGFYGLQNYGERVHDVRAIGADGSTLPVSKTSPSRWTVATGDRPAFTVTSTVDAPRGTNLSNGVSESSAGGIGPATYITLVESSSGVHRPAALRLDLPASSARPDTP